MTRRAAPLALVLAVLTLGAAAPAQAVTVTIDDGVTLLVRPDGPRDVASLIVRRTSNGAAYEVQATGGTLVDGHHCEPAGPGLVVCTPTSAPPFFSVQGTLGEGDDRIVIQDSGGTIQANLTGGGGNDAIAAGAGADQLYGTEGDDVLRGGGGADRLYGDNGSDDLDGQDDGDQVYGGRGADSMADTGPAGADLLAYGAETHDFAERSIGVSITVANRAADDGSADDGPQGARDNVGAGFEAVSATNVADVLTGSGAAETLLGGGGNDTVEGGAGPDTLRGGAGADTLRARDGVDDTLIDCDFDTSTQSPDDRAEVDVEPRDARVVNCETVERGAGTSSPQPTPPPLTGVKDGCPSDIDLYMRDDYDVDKLLAGKMRVVVDLPIAGFSANAFLTQGPDENERLLIGPSATAQAGPHGAVVRMPLKLNDQSRSQYAGKARTVTVNVVVSAPDCPSIAIAQAVEVEPRPEGEARAPATSRVAKRTIRDRAPATTCGQYFIGNAGFSGCDPVVAPPSPKGCEQDVPITNVIRALATCIKQPDKKNRPGYWETTGRAQMNGLIIEPMTGSTTIWWDTSKLEFGFRGKVKIFFKVRLPIAGEREVVLFESSEDRSWSLFANDLYIAEKNFAKDAEIGGFKLDADLELDFTARGTQTLAKLALPDWAGGLQAQMNLTIGWGGSIELEGLSLAVPEINAFGLTLKNGQLTFTRVQAPGQPVQESWLGRTTIVLPPMGGDERPEFGIGMQWTNGKWVAGRIEGNNLRQLFGGPLISLDQVSGSLVIGDRPQVDLRARVAFGPKIRGGDPPELAYVDGQARYLAPSKDGKSPGVFTFEGAFTLWQLGALSSGNASATVVYQTDGAFSFGGNAQAVFGSAGVEGQVSGSVLGRSFSASGSLEVYLGKLRGQGKLAVNNDGATACLSTAVAGAGWTYDFKTRKLDPFQQCGLAEWQKVFLAARKPGTRSTRQAGANKFFEVKPGTKRFALDVPVGAAAPGATLVSPSGKVVQPALELDGHIYFAVDAAEAGGWTLEVPGRQGDPLLAVDRVPITVEAKIDKSERPRLTVDYESRGLRKADRIEFYEQIGAVRRLIKEVGPAGGFSFTPADLKGRKRQLVAVPIRAGAPGGEEFVVGTFSAGPAPFPGAIPARRGVITVGGNPTYIGTTRRGDDLTFTWGDASNADGYEAYVRLSDGRTYTRMVRSTKVRIPDVDNELGYRIRVRAFNEDLEFGPDRTAERSSRKVKEKAKRPPRLKDPDEVGYAEVRRAAD